jgi:autotransporter-associated beta strand protein
LQLTAAAGGSVEFSGGIVDGANTGSITKTGDGTVALSGQNVYDGDTTVSAGTLTVAATTGSLQINVGATGVNNKVTGSGALNFNGVLALNLAAAGTTVGNSWNVIDVGTLTETYGAGFSVRSTVQNAAFSNSSGTWTIVENGVTYQFVQSTGVLSVIPGGSSPYDTWASGFAGFTPTTPGLDFDNDGLSNLLEFVLGGNPTISQSGIRPSVTAAGSDLVITFQRSDESETDSVAVKVQTSTTLGSWTDDTPIGASNGSGPNGITYTVAENGGAADTIVVTIPKGVATRKFARVVATK